MSRTRGQRTEPSHVCTTCRMFLCCESMPLVACRADAFERSLVLQDIFAGWVGPTMFMFLHANEYQTPADCNYWLEGPKHPRQAVVSLTPESLQDWHDWQRRAR